MRIKEKNMIIDTHAHYDDEQFDPDREELLEQMHREGIGMIVNAGSTLESWDRITELTEKHPFVYGAIGIHPDEARTLTEADMERMKALLDLRRSWRWERSGWIITGINPGTTSRKSGLSASLKPRGRKRCR